MTHPDQPGLHLPLGRLALASAGMVTLLGLVATAVAAHRAGVTAASVLAPAAITAAAFAYGVAFLCLLEPRPAAAWGTRIVQLVCVRTALSMTLAVALAQALQIRPVIFWGTLIGLTLVGVLAEILVLATALRGPARASAPDRPTLGHPSGAMAPQAST